MLRWFFKLFRKPQASAHIPDNAPLIILVHKEALRLMPEMRGPCEWHERTAFAKIAERWSEDYARTQAVVRVRINLAPDCDDNGDALEPYKPLWSGWFVRGKLTEVAP